MQGFRPSARPPLERLKRNGRETKAERTGIELPAKTREKTTSGGQSGALSGAVCADSTLARFIQEWTDARVLGIVHDVPGS